MPLLGWRNRELEAELDQVRAQANAASVKRREMVEGVTSLVREVREELEGGPLLEEMRRMRALLRGMEGRA